MQTFCLGCLNEARRPCCNRVQGGTRHSGVSLRGLTFELTPTAEAGSVSRDCDDSTTGAGPAYAACRSGSGVERGVRPRSAALRVE